MSGESFVSYARNGEDVVVWRALGGVAAGRAVGVGDDDRRSSVTRGLAERGWSAVTVDPHELVGPDARRTLDDVLDAAGFAARDLHLLSVSAGGAEDQVLAGCSLDRWRPWVLVVAGERTVPGYARCQFDGVATVLVADERAAELQEALSRPVGLPGVLDDWSRAADRDLAVALDEARRDAVRWRGVALAGWADAATARTTDADYDSLANHARHLEDELAALRSTVSWRVTAPLRAVRSTRGGR